MIASLLAVYIVLRPFSPSFRIKRMLFNLAEASDVRLSASSATWHVSRSVGLYQRERALLGDFHLKGAREKPFGLIVNGNRKLISCRQSKIDQGGVSEGRLLGPGRGRGCGGGSCRL